MADLREKDPGNWDVVINGRVIGSVSSFNLLGTLKFTGLMTGTPVEGGPFNSESVAAQAVEKAWHDQEG